MTVCKPVNEDLPSEGLHHGTADQDLHGQGLQLREAESRQRTYQVCKMVPETVTKEVQYTVCEPKTVTKTRTVTECTMQQVQEEVTCTVCVPVTVQKEVQVKVCKMVQKTITVPAGDCCAKPARRCGLLSRRAAKCCAEPATDCGCK